MTTLVIGHRGRSRLTKLAVSFSLGLWLSLGAEVIGPITGPITGPVTGQTISYPSPAIAQSIPAAPSLLQPTHPPVATTTATDSATTDIVPATLTDADEPAGQATNPTTSADTVTYHSTSPEPASAHTESRILLSLQEKRVYLYRGEMLVSSYPVGIGTAETPTPQGEFSVSQMVVEPRWQSPWTGEIHEPGPNSALGLRWIGFTSNETGAFGFHGTPTVESIGQAASNGCVRMYNDDVVALFTQVSMGTPVIVTQ